MPTGLDKLRRMLGAKTGTRDEGLRDALSVSITMLRCSSPVLLHVCLHLRLYFFWLLPSPFTSTSSLPLPSPT